MIRYESLFSLGFTVCLLLPLLSHCGSGQREITTLSQIAQTCLQPTLRAMHSAFQTDALVLIKETDRNHYQGQSVPSSGDDLSMAQGKGRERQP